MKVLIAVQKKNESFNLELKEKKNGLKKEQGELVSSDTEDGK
jgi:hypothetical protein